MFFWNPLAFSVAAKWLQLCPTLCDPINGSPPGSPVSGIFQARTLEWVAISFFNAWKWKEKVQSLSRVRLLATPWTAAYQASPSMGFFQARVLEWVAITFSRLPVQETQETHLWSLGQEDPLEEGMATHSNILARRISGTEEPGGLRSIGSQRVAHDWRDLVCVHTRSSL